MTEWLSASAMLLAGVIVGAMFLYGMRRRQDRGDLERADLEAKRDALILSSVSLKTTPTN